MASNPDVKRIIIKNNMAKDRPYGKTIYFFSCIHKNKVLLHLHTKVEN